MSNILAIPALQRIFGNNKSESSKADMDDATLEELNTALEKYCKEHSIRCDKATESPKSDPLGIKVKSSKTSKTSKSQSKKSKKGQNNKDDELIK